MGKPAIEPLIAALDSRSVRTRRFAIHVIGKLRDRRAIIPLIKLLHDPKSQIRVGATIALDRIGGTQAIKPLVSALGDQDEFVRDSATFALIRIGKPAVPPLRGALRHANLNVRMNAAFALRKIGFRLGARGLKLASRKEKQKYLEIFSKISDIKQLEKKAASKVREIARKLPVHSGMPFWGDTLPSFSSLDHSVREALGKTPWNMKLADSMREEAEKIRKQINPVKLASDDE